MENKKEKKLLLAVTLMFTLVFASAWYFAYDLKNKISASSVYKPVDSYALVDVEKLRHLGQAQLNQTLQYFLLGSSSYLEERKKMKEDLTSLISDFQKKYDFLAIDQIKEKLLAWQDQEQDYYEQGTKFRANQEESKNIGYYYRSKATPLVAQLNKQLDQIIILYKNAIAENSEQSKTAAQIAEVAIPELMTGLTLLTAMLFASLSIMLFRLLRQRQINTAERARLYKEAQKAINSRDEIAASIAEDLKTPFKEINRTAEELKTNSENPDLIEGIELIQSSVGLVEANVKDILDQAKSESDEITLRLDQFRIESVLEEAKNLFYPIAKKKDVKLDIEAVNPPTLAFMDHERVKRVLVNLIGNAIKFTPRLGKVSVKVKSDQQFVYVSVKDSGPGIPESKRGEIFDQYWQRSKTADQGAGVGLAVVKSIVRAHGGVVTLESGRHGSTFTFSLPKRRPAGANIYKPQTIKVRTEEIARPASNG